MKKTTLFFVPLIAIFTALGCQNKGLQAQQIPLKRTTPPATDFPNVGHIDADGGTCSGTLLKDDWVLTAAHCVDALPAKDYRFTLHPNPEKAAAIDYVQVDTIRIHPEYVRKEGTPGVENETLGVDVALLHLAKPASLFAKDKLMTVSHQVLNSTDTLLNVGYGENADGTYGYRKVKDVRFTNYFDLPTKTLKIFGGGIDVTRGHSGELGCMGDSGSPLVAVSGGKYLIMGVFSTTETKRVEEFPEDLACKSGDTHGNYIATASFESWVAAEIKAL